MHMQTKMPNILDCSMGDCSYNKSKQCHAMAITISESMCPAECNTFMKSTVKGGALDEQGSVGACKVEKCKFNKSLECSAPSIHVKAHSGHPDCSTFSAR